jgi:hypothetical protein
MQGSGGKRAGGRGSMQVLGRFIQQVTHRLCPRWEWTVAHGPREVVNRKLSITLGEGREFTS